MGPTVGMTYRRFMRSFDKNQYRFVRSHYFAVRFKVYN